jgi:hypothetical protein
MQHVRDGVAAHSYMLPPYPPSHPPVPCKCLGRTQAGSGLFSSPIHNDTGKLLRKPLVAPTGSHLLVGSTPYIDWGRSWGPLPLGAYKPSLSQRRTLALVAARGRRGEPDLRFTFRANSRRTQQVGIPRREQRHETFSPVSPSRPPSPSVRTTPRPEKATRGEQTPDKISFLNQRLQRN